MIEAEQIKVLRKTRTHLEEVMKDGEVEGYIPINETATGVKVVRLSDMKIKGLYNVCKGLINSGKLRRYNANGTVKLDDAKTTVYIDYDEFNQLTEF